MKQVIVLVAMIIVGLVLFTGVTTLGASGKGAVDNAGTGITNNITEGAFAV